MNIDRSNIVRGPAIVTFDSVVMYTEEDIVLSPGISTFPVETSMFGNVGDRLNDIVTEITFKPAGIWAYRSVLLPYTTPAIGDSIFGAADKDITIQTEAGQLLTWKAAAVTQMPDLYLSTTKQLFGQVTFTCIGALATAWDDAAKRGTVAANAFADTSFDPTDILTQEYTLAWGVATPWDDIETEDGATVSFNVNVEPVMSDRDGTIDMTLQSVEAMVRLVPLGISESQLLSLLKIQGSNVKRGADMATINSNAFNASGTGVYVRLYDATPNEGPFRFGRSTLRAGEVAFKAQQGLSSGSQDALFYIGTEAPA